MIDKAYLEKAIINDFPDLKKIRFIINNELLGLFTETSLLPFLIYQNTMDSKNRLIELYLQPNSASSHFLPFYIALGFYRKAVNKALNAEHFYSSKFAPDAKKVVVKGNVCSITSINYINKSISLRGGMEDFEIPFSEDYCISWLYDSAKDLKDKLSSFQRISSASDDNLFSLPITKNDNSHEGIILFTNISKFQALLRNLKISGSDLSKHLHIEKTVFKDDFIKFELISSLKTREQPITVMASRLDTIFAFDNILEHGEGKLDQLRTVIIEDFDVLVGNWEKSGDLYANLNLLDEIYFKRLGSHLKDVYLICKNKNFNIHSILVKHGIASFTWMLKLGESYILDELGDIRDVKVKRISNDFTDRVIEKVESIILKWKNLAKEFFCNGQILDVIRRLYIIRDKMRSFYESSGFNAILHEMIQVIQTFSQSWFVSNQDNGLIEETKILLDGLIATEFSISENLAKWIISFIDSEKYHSLIIVSNNKDLGDQNHIANLLSVLNLNLKFIDNKVFLQEKIHYSVSNEMIIYLNWNKEIINTVLTDISLPSQSFLVCKKGYNFIAYYSEKASQALTKISNTNEKYELLNLSGAEKLNELEVPMLNFTYLDDHEDIAETLIEIIPLQEVEESIQEIVWTKTSGGIPSVREQGSYVVFFEDGSQMVFSEHQIVFFYQEDSPEGGTDYEKEVASLVAGDLIVVPKDRGQIKLLLNNALSGKDEYTRSVGYDLEWRKRIASFIEVRGGDIAYFRKMLKENGFPISVDFTIKKWIEGETLQPHRFKQLLLTLVKMGLIEDCNKDTYYLEIKNLKKLKSSFIRIAMQKLMYSLKGINHGWEVDLFDDSLLSRFLDHVEIKTVLIVLPR